MRFFCSSKITELPLYRNYIQSVQTTGFIPKVVPDSCVGCGKCYKACPIAAIEKGQLQELIFDNQAFASHRAMAAVLSAILKLPPIKQAMSSKQMKSVYLERLISKLYKE